MYVDISITEEDLRLIMGKPFEPRYAAALRDAFCPACRQKEDNAVRPEKLWLNPAGDVIVEGACSSCGAPVEKLLETGVEPRQYDQAMAIREYKVEIGKDYEIRQVD
ncbi:MAG: hypothetical protein RIC19_10185 [Phaeodactylibacter sp.]|uniref:hypothetical protein n=1 Tax=Phaeodactylibacter sp. TaxID=1940289 RepID=UPI0032EC9390